MKTAKEILHTFESFKYTEDGCDELHYYEDNVLMAMEQYAQQQVKNSVDLGDVSQQRELLNALADDFNDSTDTYVGQTRIEEVLKAFNCGITLRI